jgi:hypothetical protein
MAERLGQCGKILIGGIRSGNAAAAHDRWPCSVIVDDRYNGSSDDQASPGAPACD